MTSFRDQHERSTSPDEGMRGRDIRELVQEHYKVVYRFAYRLSGNTIDAEDLTQQAFAVACEKLDQVRDETRVRSWLFTIVRNAFLKNLPPSGVEVEPFEEELAWEEDTEEWPPEIDEHRLQAALDEMSETLRTPVLLYYFEEMSYKEIAGLLEIPVGTVMSRLARGKRFLKKQLTGKRSPVTFNER
jgi:RNA polymerase sigma-70 factor, ECF subfamily